MQITSTTPTASAQLFGGLFDQQALAGNGLFGLLMALFGQQGGENATLLTGQNLPGTQSPLGGTALLDPSTLLLQGDMAQPADATLSATDLLNLLQQLSGEKPLSAELQNLLTGDQLNAAMLESRLDALPPEQYEAVMAELSALLQPVFSAMPTPVKLELATLDLPEISAAAPQQPASALLPELPEPTLAPLNASAEADAPAPASPALATLTQVLQNQQDKAQTRGREKDAPTGLSNALNQVSENGSESAEAQRTESSGLPALAAAKSSPLSAAPDAPLSDDMAKAGAAATTAPSTSATPVFSAKPQGEGKTQTAQAIQAPTPSSDSGSNAATLKEAMAQTPMLTQPGADKPETKFIDHLEQVKLNRTGAHQPVTEQVAVHLSRAVQQGQERMTIRLHPAELGRIEIKLDLSAEGVVKASFHIDQPATLDLLQRDAKGLEKALGDAGLKTDGGSLNFNLRGDSLPQRQGQQDQNGQQNGQSGEPSGFSLDGEDANWTPAGILETTWYIGPDRVDVRI
jgi:flagellar hook-length control protein FliK